SERAKGRWARSCERTMDEPLHRPGCGALAVSEAEQPVSATALGLDLEVVPHEIGSIDFYTLFAPPLGIKARRAIGACYPVRLAAPDEQPGRMVGQEGHDIYPLRRLEQAARAGQVFVPYCTRLWRERRDTTHFAFGHGACLRLCAVKRTPTEPVSECIH